jgi:type IV pilus assembly protein PilW
MMKYILTSPQPSQQKQRGLTLLELLIAMFLGTLLILGATSMFIANKRVYKEVDFQGRLAENARFGMEMMIRDLRMAGFRGCAVNQDVENNLNVKVSGKQDPKLLLSFIANSTSECASKGITDADCVQTNSIEGREAGSAEWQPSGSLEPTDITIDNASDAFTVRFMEDTNTNLCKDMSETKSDAEADNQTSTVLIPAGLFVSGGIFAAADCEATNIFQLTKEAPGVSGKGPFVLEHSAGATFTPGNEVNTFSKLYTAGTASCAASPVDIFVFRARRYFVATDSTIVGEDNIEIPALYRQTFEINTNSSADSTVPEIFSERLIDGVENMQILYGEDTSGDRVADAYKKADDDTIVWGNVVSVKLAVLFANVEQDFSGPLDTKSDYQLLDAPDFDPTPGDNDHRRRKIVEATVSLRNRQLSL